MKIKNYLFVLALCLININKILATDLTIGSGTTVANFPFNNLNLNYKTQVIYLQSELGASKILTNLALDISRVSSAANTGNRDFKNFTIKLLHTSSSSFGAAFISTAAATTVFTSSSYAMPTSTGYLSFDITDFYYNGSDNLLVEIVWGANTAVATPNNYQVNCTATASATVAYGNTGTPPVYAGNSTSRPNIKFTYTNETTWTGTTNTDWNTATNWGNGIVPTSSISVTIPNVTNQPTISASTTANCLDLTINTGATLTVSISAGFFNIYGNILNNGTIDHAGPSLIYLFGTSKTIGGSGANIYLAFSIRTGASYTLSSDYDVLYQLAFQSGTSTMNLSSYRLSVYSFQLGAGVINLNTGTLEIGKELTTGAGTFNCNTGTVYYNSGDDRWVNDGEPAENQTIRSLTYYDLKIRTNNGYTATIGSGSDFTVNNNLTIINPGDMGGVATTAYNISLNGNLSVGAVGNYGVVFNLGHRIARTTGSGTGIFTMKNDGDDYYGDSMDGNTINVTYSSATQCALALGASGANTSLTFYGKVNYNSASSQLVMGPNYKNIEFLGTGTKTLSCDLDIEKDLTLTQGTLDVGTGSTSYSSTASTSCGNSTEVAATPFNPRPSDNKVQYLFLASELLSFGLSANSEILKTSYYVCGYDGISYTYNNFTAKLGHTSVTNLNTVMASPSMTTVLTPSILTVSGNGNVDINFTSPFVWDGTSNLVVEYCFDNCDDASCSDFSRGLQEVYVDPSTSPNYFSAEDFSNTGTDMCSSTTVTNKCYQRPKTSFSATAQRTIHLAGNWINHASNTIDFTYRQSTVYFDGSSTQLINQNGRNIDFYNVIVDGSDVRFYNAGANSASQNVAVNNDLTINSSKVLKFYKPASSSSNGNITVASNFVNNGTFNQTNDANYFTMSGSTKTISGSGIYTDAKLQVSGVVAFDGTISSGSFSQTLIDATKTLIVNSSKTFINGILTNNGTFALSSSSIWKNSGNFTNNAAMTADVTSTVEFNGSAAQTVKSNAAEFGNVIINNSISPAAIDGILLSDKMTLSSSSALTLTDGIIIPNGNLLELKNTAATAIAAGIGNTDYTASWVYGTSTTSCLRRYLADNTDTYIFPVGIATRANKAELINNSLTNGGSFYIDSWFNPSPTSPNLNFPSNLAEMLTSYASAHASGVWVLDHSGTIDGTYDLKLYFNGGFAGLADSKFNILSRTTGSITGADWTLKGTASPTTVASGYAYRKGMNTFSEKGIGITSEILPVELLSFRAICLSNNIEITWVTVSELNSDFFSIERSYDLLNWELVALKQSAGNSNSQITYNFSDNNANMNSSSIYYRLKQTDFNGSFEYFDPVTVQCVDELSFEIISVNKYESDLEIEFIKTSDDDVRISLYNIAGQKVCNQTISSEKGLNKAKIKGIDLKTGLYMLLLENENICLTRKIYIGNLKH
ncbi:MAG: T9SS type A sorting domain-containing protein [Bacteroidota bacterium]